MFEIEDIILYDKKRIENIKSIVVIDQIYLWLKGKKNHYFLKSFKGKYSTMLKTLHINGFKNLDKFEIDFTNKDGITVLIGNNGSGKSNILEAISAIFANLYKQETLETRKWDFDYNIEYEINNKNISINYKKNINKFSVTKINSYGIESVDDRDINNFLPNTCYMIYNGDDQRIKRKYYNQFLKKFRDSRRTENTKNELLPKMVYIDSFFWNISLIALLKSDNEIHKKFCQSILKNNDLTNIVIKFTFNEKYKSKIYDEFLINLFGISSLGIEEELSYKTLINSTQSEKNIFTILLSMIGTNNKINKLIIESNGINTMYLSEGEKKQILLKSIISVMAKENDLLLMDEVDSSIHVGNKIKIKDMLKRSNVGKTIITTHSPSLTHSFEEKHINMVLDGKIENKEKQDIFSHLSNGIWNYQEQSIFLSSPHEIELLVEGKFDKAHIETALYMLSDDFPDLKCGIFDLDGCEKQKKFFDAMCNAKNLHLESKKLIFIFDNEKQFINNDDIKAKELKGSEKVDDNIYVKNNIYMIFLPKRDGHKDNFTIENMYDGSKYKECLTDAFSFITNDKCNDFIDNISENIKETSKKLLAEKCKGFDKIDFEHFKELFKLIQKVKNI